MSQHSQFPVPDSRNFQHPRSPFAMSDVRGTSNVAGQEGASRSNSEMDLNQSQGTGSLSRVGQPGQPDYLEGIGPLGQAQAPSIGPMATNRTPMENFISVHQESPWAPVILTDAQRQQLGSKGAANNRFQTPNGPFMTYRNHTAQSECDTSVHGGVNPDSGFYGSNPPPSTGLPSTYDDGNTDTHSLAGHLEGFGFPGIGHDMSPGSQPSQWPIGSSQTGMSPPPAKTAPNRIPCPDSNCNHESKTKSEHNKHVARHTRPHRCKVPGCTHQGGFSTSNDLDRHKRSRHPEVMSSGNSFRCREGNCAGKKKIWPRADNFRSHLKRVHKKEFKREDELDFYLVKPDDTPPNLLAGLASSGFSFAGAMGGEAINPGMLHIRPDTLGHGFALDGRGSQVGDGMAYPGYLNPYAFGPNQSLDLSPSAEMPPPTRLGLGTLPELEESREPTDTVSQVGSTHTGAWQSNEHQQQSSYASSTPRVELSVEEDNSTRVGEQAGHMEVDDQDSEMDGEAEADAVPESVQEPVAEISSRTNPAGDERSRSSDSTSSSDTPGEATPAESLPSQSQALQDKAAELPRPESTQDQQQEPEGQSESESDDTSSASDSDAQDVSAQAPGGEDKHSADPEPSVAAPDPKVLLADKFKLDDEDTVMQMMLQIQDNGMLDKMLDKLGYSKAKSPSGRSTKRGANGQSQSGDLVPQKCSRCPKEFKRPCELKKHQKRHDKPYGCTRCNQRFGSKNDWKRHETGQHAQLDVWKCSEKLPSSVPKNSNSDSTPQICQRVYHRRETFRTHLQKDHKLSENKNLDARLEACKVGKDGDARFWCGFCAKLVDAAELSSGGIAGAASASNEDVSRGGQRRLDRFDHIDDHYCGRNGFSPIDCREWREPDALELPLAGSEAAAGGKGKGKERRGQGRPDPNTRWFCCQCSNYWDTDVNNCFECGHPQCHECKEGLLPDKS